MLLQVSSIELPLKQEINSLIKPVVFLFALIKTVMNVLICLLGTTSLLAPFMLAL